MHFSKNDLVLLYNSENSKDRKTLAYALTITKKVNKQELNSVRVSDTLFRMMLDKLSIDGKKLLNKADPFYQSNIKGKDLDPEEWYNVLRSRPSLLRSPVAFYRDKAIICETPTDVLRVM